MARDGEEPIAENEIIYRRVPVSQGYYDPHKAELSPQAFAPDKTRDTNGLSVERAKYKSAEEASRGRPEKAYYVAVYRASDLISSGIAIVPAPHKMDGSFSASHALLTDLTSARRKDSDTLTRKEFLARSFIRVEGPFLTPPNEGEATPQV